ncbi:Protein SMG5 [Taenia solium]|eukprot:TsM_000414900 transcript=TsM_000414900 gene=TsM_000414900
MDEAWSQPGDSAPSKQDVLFKNAGEIIQRLDVLSKNETLSKSLFDQSANSHRLRLRNILIKLIFMDPVKFGNRCEELMWQRVFYEPIRIAKTVIHSPEISDQTHFIENYRAHLISALGFYQNLLVRLQQEFYRPDVWPDAWRMVGIHRISHLKDSEISVVNSQLAERVAHKALIYIGDLYRYRVEVGDFYSRAIAYTYYKVAAAINPDNGTPHNQLGTLDVSRCFGLNTVFHCLRAIVSPAPFEGAKGNLATFLLNNEARFVFMRENEFPMPSLHSQVMNRKAAIKLKDLRITIIKYLFFVHLNAQAFLKSDMGIVQSLDDVQLLNEVVDDISFMLHSETKRFGAKCINRMLPKFSGTFNRVPDFCPDPESLGRQKTASTPLLPPVVLRMILIVLLFTELLSENKDKLQEATVAQLFECSKELPLFTLYSLDLLLVHSFRAIAKTVNMFKLAALKRLGAVRSKTSNTLHKSFHCGNQSLKEKSERVISIKEDICEGSSDAEEHNEELEVGSLKDDHGGGEESEESVSSEMSSRGPRLRRLRPRCRMMEEDDFLNSSFSEEDEDEDSEYSEESDEYDEQDWNFPDEDNMGANLNELKSQNSESPLSCEEEVTRSQSDSAGIRDVLAAPVLTQTGQTFVENDAEIQLYEVSSQGRGSESESEKEVDHGAESGEKDDTGAKEEAALSDDDDDDNDDDPAGHYYIWLRLFVTAYFVDSLLSGIKLITDWLFFSQTFLQHAASTYKVLMQEIASHLASLLNYLSPIVYTVEQELSSDLLIKSEYLGLPMNGIRTPTILPHISTRCRELLKREFQQKDDSKRTALPEDWLLRGMPSLSSLHRTLDFDTDSLDNRMEESILRCLALIRFGRKFAKLADGLGLNFVYHQDVNYFTAPLPSNAARSTSHCRLRCHSGPPSQKYIPKRGRRRRKRETHKPRVQSFRAVSQHVEKEQICPDQHSTTSVDKPASTSLAMREETMRNMAKMRLKNQVDRLSEEMDKRVFASVPSGPLAGQKDSNLPFSPYIVVDTFCLIGNTTFMKRLFASHQYVIIIPRKVISHLDQLKKTTATARSATRVLEEQTGGGSGYVRIQTEDENPRGRIKLRLSKSRSNSTEAADSCIDAPVDFSVVSRWASIIECAIYFAQMSQETSHFRGVEINLAKSGEVVNLLEYQSSVAEDVSCAKITVLVGSKSAGPKDLEIPLDLAKIAWESGIVFEPLHQFAQRWKSKGR